MRRCLPWSNKTLRARVNSKAFTQVKCRRVPKLESKMSWRAPPSTQQTTLYIRSEVSRPSTKSLIASTYTRTCMMRESQRRPLISQNKFIQRKLCPCCVPRPSASAPKTLRQMHPVLEPIVHNLASAFIVQLTSRTSWIRTCCRRLPRSE